MILVDEDEGALDRAAGLLSRGRAKKARRQLAPYLTSQPDDVRARFLSLMIQRHLGERSPEEVITVGRAILDATAAESVDRVVATRSFSALLCVTRNFDEAAELATSLVERDPSDAKAHLTLALCLVEMNETQAAWEHFSQSMAAGFDLGSPDARRVAYAMARKDGGASGRARALQHSSILERCVIRTRVLGRLPLLVAAALASAGIIVESVWLLSFATALYGWLGFTLAYLCWGCCTKRFLRYHGLIVPLLWSTLLPERYHWTVGLAFGVAAAVGIAVLVRDALRAGADPEQARA